MNPETTAELDNDKGELTAELQAPTLSLEERALLEEMIKSGVIYGRKKSKTNPRMSRYLFGTRKGIEIFDLPQTLRLLDQAVVFLREKISQKAMILVVGTQPAAKDSVKSFSEKFGFSYVTERWLGGTLTNFKVISKRVEYFIRLKTDRAAGQLEKYTKKERLKIDELIVKLSKVFSGIEKMNRVPDALIIVDTEEHQTAVREVNRLKIPFVGVASSDSNPDQIQYIIPANDNARSSIKWILEYMEKKLSEAPAEAAPEIASQ